MATESAAHQRIEGKVAAVLTDRELVINRGSADGVEVGMRFAILNRNGVNVRDPDTNELLGSVEVVKTLVKVVRVEGEKLCVARTFRTIKGTPGLADALLRTAAATAVFTGTADRVETLKLDAHSTAKTEIAPGSTYIHPGDTAVQVINDDYGDE